jgi:hypothetical protein
MVENPADQGGLGDEGQELHRGIASGAGQGVDRRRFGALPGVNSTARKPAPGEKPRVELFWSDYKLLENKLSEGARAALEKETRAIFAQAGIELTFFVGFPENQERGNTPVIRVVLMPRSAEGWTLPSDAMGAILERIPTERTVYIFVPVVERVIGASVERKEMLHDGRKAQALARALGRVLAHEAVHALDPEIPHGPEGSVMSDNLTTGLLLGHRLSFHESTTKRLLERLLRPLESPGKS